MTSRHEGKYWHSAYPDFEAEIVRSAMEKAQRLLAAQERCLQMLMAVNKLQSERKSGLTRQHYHGRIGSTVSSLARSDADLDAAYDVLVDPTKFAGAFPAAVRKQVIRMVSKAKLSRLRLHHKNLGRDVEVDRLVDELVPDMKPAYFGVF